MLLILKINMMLCSIQPNRDEIVDLSFSWSLDYLQALSHFNFVLSSFFLFDDVTSKSMMSERRKQVSPSPNMLTPRGGGTH